jgi:His/Glu/Gln/Arg/opine family amino acid ABC transporter permease subunit
MKLPLLNTLQIFGEAFLVTLQLSVVGALIAVCIGFVTGTIKSVRVPLLHLVISLYVAVVRGTPFLLIIFIIYYVFPFFGRTLSPFQSAVLGLVIHQVAYITEIVASGINAIDKGQHEAAHALGLGFFLKMRYVILPQALKIIIPGLTGQLVLLVKDTSLVSLIGLAEITRVGRQLTQRGENPFIIFLLVAGFYFIICYPVIKISERLERLNQRSLGS